MTDTTAGEASAYMVRRASDDPEEWTLMHPENAVGYIDRKGWETEPLYRRLAAQPSAGAQGEAVAWRWRNKSDGVWNYQEDRQRIPNVEQQPLYATPAQPDTGDAWNVEHKLNEAEGFGASYIREKGKWILYTMPGAKPFGAVDGYDKASIDFVMDALRGTRTKPDTGDVAALREALEPLARLEVPSRSVGNAGAYSILHSDIRRAQQVLAALSKPNAQGGAS